MTVQQPTDDTRADLIEKTRRGDLVQGLRDLADWLDRNDDVPVNYVLGVELSMFTTDYDVLNKLLRRDDLTVQSVGKWLEVSHTFAGNVQYQVNYSPTDDRVCHCGAQLYGTLRVHHCTPPG